MELLSQIGISPKLPHPLGRVRQNVEAAGAEVPDAAMHSLRGCGDWAPSWPAASLFSGAPGFCNYFREL